MNNRQTKTSVLTIVFISLITVFCGVVSLSIFDGQTTLSPTQYAMYSTASQPATPFVTADVFAATRQAVSTQTAFAVTLDAVGIDKFVVKHNADWIPQEKLFDDVMLVFVPAGCFIIGSETGFDNEINGHEVCLSPFWLDKTEVTQGQFIEKGGIKLDDNQFSGDNRPVENVTWVEAKAYCEMQGKRLPTEAEWEFAARGPDNLIYPWGNEFISDAVIYQDSVGLYTYDVGERLSGASWVGALDMAGNVWEWTASLYQPFPYIDNNLYESHPLNRITETEPVLKGGSWRSYEFEVRSSVRASLPEDALSHGIGFRCARPVETEDFSLIP